MAGTEATKPQKGLYDAKVPSIWNRIKAFFFREPLTEQRANQKLSESEIKINFLRRVNSSSPEVRKAAVIILAKKKETLAVPAILTLLRTDNDSSVRLACAIALSSFMNNDGMQEENKEFLCNAIIEQYHVEPDKKVKTKMAALLKKMGTNDDKLVDGYPHWIGEKNYEK